MEKRYLFTPGPDARAARGARGRWPSRWCTTAAPTSASIYERCSSGCSRSSAPRATCCSSRLRHGRDGLRGREPRRAGRPRRGRRRGRVRRALGRRSASTTGSRCSGSTTTGARCPCRTRSARRSPRAAPAIVFCTQSETSTGVVSDVQALKAAVGDATLVVDAVSSLGAVPLETDAWGIDVVVSRLAEGADVPARPRDGERRRAALGHAAARRGASTSTGARRRRRRRSSTRPSRRRCR